MVGAVVVDAAGKVAGEGFHEKAGRPHAEREALRRAGKRARGGTLYTNLEPCVHQGRTPPCVEAVIAAGVRRVVTSMIDPDPRVRGAGIARLREAGIEVDVGVQRAEAERLNEFYIKHRSTGRPFVTAKYAISLDGKIATRTGDSRWITGEDARRHTHWLRSMHDAIMVGINTVLRDDPELTARLPDARQPLRVIADSNLRTPATAKVLPGALIMASEAAPTERALALREAGAEVQLLPFMADGRLELEAVLDELGRRQLLSLLVEGGGELHGAFFSEGLVDKVCAYVGPLVVGGVQAPGPVGGEGAARLADAWRLQDVEMTRVGEDMLVSGYVHRDR
jgi:diaminohydroxyphosphoribosylaminopyrimidine deaminase/5-amino-6-(5-phosphoribosylamino)uracil reductase